MPNYKLGDYSRGQLHSHANALLNRLINIIETDFPLDANEINDGILEQRYWEMMHELDDHGVQVSSSRVATFRVEAQRLSWVMVQSHQQSCFPEFKASFRDRPIFNPGVLDEKKRIAFIKWVDAATLIHRRVKAAKNIVREFINDHCGDSMASMRTRWPNFAIVALSLDEPWPDRMRDATRIKRTEYGWNRVAGDQSYQWYVENMERLDIVGAMLAQANTTPVIHTHNLPLVAEIRAWEVDGKMESA